MTFFTQAMGSPAGRGASRDHCEAISSVALMAGFLTRVTAVSYIVIMLGAIATVHWPHRFFMN